MERVDEAVANHPELFGGGDVEFRTLGTFDSHAIVMNANGEFFRVEHGFDDEGSFVLGEVKQIDAPVKEASELGGDTRSEAYRAVEAMLAGDSQEASKRIGSLYNLVSSGVRLTVEGVEDDLVEFMSTECGWVDAVLDNAGSIRGFVGADANKELPVPRWQDISVVEDEAKARGAVRESLRRLHETLKDMQREIVLARRVDGSYVLRANGEADAEMASSDFVEFVDLFSNDLDVTTGLVEDALSVSEDGSVGSLARIHDGVAARVREMGLAAAFASKFALRFDAPHEA